MDEIKQRILELTELRSQILKFVDAELARLNEQLIEEAVLESQKYDYEHPDPFFELHGHREGVVDNDCSLCGPQD